MIPVHNSKPYYTITIMQSLVQAHSHLFNVEPTIKKLGERSWEIVSSRYW